MANPDAIVALGGPTPAESNMRVDAAVAQFCLQDAPLIVTGAYWAYQRRRDEHEPTIARQMGDYAIQQGVPEDRLVIADQSLNTIGDALAVKYRLCELGAIRAIRLATTASHLARATMIFTHVLGPEYTVTPINAGTFPGRRFQAIYELAAKCLTHAVLDGTTPGDDEAIMERLFALVPGYTAATKMDIFANHLRRCLRIPLARFTPVRQFA